MILLAGIAACAIPVSTGTKYPIDVFMENESPERPYSEIKNLEITQEDSLVAITAKDSPNRKYKGNSVQQKEILKAQLVLRAQKLGANALVNVRYQYFATMSNEGYTISGVAVRYRGE